MGFQSQVNQQLAPAVAGDFASSNPRATVLAGPGGLVAGAEGVSVGRFAWVADDGVTVHNYGVGAGAPSGFVHREQQALITTYLAEASNVVPSGLPITLHSKGDFWAINNGPSAMVVGGAIYADYSTGLVYTAAPTGASATGAIGATFTASADTDPTRLVVTAVTGKIHPGDTVSGTGITAGTTVVSQVSGTTGGAGTYQLSASNTASAATVTAFGDTLVISAVASGVLAVGDTVSGTGIPSGATIASQVSGAVGGVGTYTISSRATAYAASTAITVVDGVQVTGWTSQSAAAVGELVKISTWG